jgi:hypothetical protein
MNLPDNPHGAGPHNRPTERSTKFGLNRRRRRQRRKNGRSFPAGVTLRIIFCYKRDPGDRQPSDPRGSRVAADQIEAASVS